MHDLPASVGSLTVHRHGSHSRSTEDVQPEDSPEEPGPFHDHADHLLIPPGRQWTYTYELMDCGGPDRAAFR